MGEAGVQVRVRCVKPWPLWVIMCPLWGGFFHSVLGRVSRLAHGIGLVLGKVAPDHGKSRGKG